jgi:hypothetical protein
MSNVIDKMEKEFLKGKGMRRPELSTDYYNRKLESKFLGGGRKIVRAGVRREF